jgi:hypothetical protein
LAGICNPSYSGGSDEEDHDSKPVQAKKSARPYFEKTPQKRAGGGAQGVDPEFKTQVLQKKKKRVLV